MIQNSTSKSDTSAHQSEMVVHQPDKPVEVELTRNGMVITGMVVVNQKVEDLGKSCNRTVGSSDGSKILSISLGYREVGFAIVECSGNHHIVVSGCIRPMQDRRLFDEIGDECLQLTETIEAIIRDFEIKRVIIEFCEFVPERKSINRRMYAGTLRGSLSYLPAQIEWLNPYDTRGILGANRTGIRHPKAVVKTRWPKLNLPKLKRDRLRILKALFAFIVAEKNHNNCAAVLPVLSKEGAH